MTQSRTTGFPSPAENEIEAPIDLSAVLDLKNPARYPVRVRGVSFKDRGILDDDVLIVDTSAPPKDGMLVVASYMGKVILAELRKQHGNWYLLSGDDSHERLPVNPALDIEIWACVRSVVRIKA